MTNSKIVVPGGELAFGREGDGDNHVLLIQGVGTAGAGWAPQIEGFKSEFNVCAFDHRGVGSSTGTPTTIDAMAEDAVRVMDALGWQSAHIVGHSMGASVALAMALSFRERIRSLSLLCGLARGSRVVRFDLKLLWRQVGCQIGTQAMRRHAFFRLVSPRDIWGDESHIAQLEQAFGRSLTDLPKVTMKQVAALRKFDVYQKLSSLRGLPALVLSATDDIVSPPSEGALIAKALETRFVEVEGGHAVTIQDAFTINQHLVGHFRSS